MRKNSLTLMICHWRAIRVAFVSHAIPSRFVPIFIDYVHSDAIVGRQVKASLIKGYAECKKKEARLMICLDHWPNWMM